MRYYGKRSALPKGVPENPANCIAEIMRRTGWPIAYQCQNKRGYGPEGRLCQVHARKIKKGGRVSVPEDE